MPEIRSTSLERVLPKLAKFALIAVAGALILGVLAAAALFELITGPYRSTHPSPYGHDRAARIGATTALVTALVALIEVRRYRQALQSRFAETSGHSDS